ncbi:hypothetical protein [Aeromicrobium sp.]|uniref:hypothetical protein n=1 Tax=Aeromicrobium sp. TaxID=1871063 RepID=UPI0030BEB72F
MQPRLALTSILVPLLVIAAAITAGRWAGGEVAADTRSSLTAALDALPDDTSVASFTDWSQIRAELDLGSATTPADRAALTDDALLRDLTTRSVLGQYTEEMHDVYGWSPADLEWEAYGQAADGAAMIASLDRSVSFSTVRSRLKDLGYAEDGGVWSLGADDATTEAGVELTSTLGSIALLPRQRLIVAADRSAYVSTVLKTVDGEAMSLLSVRSVSGVAAALAGADTALLQSGPFTCETTSLRDAGPEVAAQARAAIDRAGGLVRPSFTGRALDGGSSSTETMRFALAFASPEVAARQLRAREALASGPFIGRSGRIEESLVLRSSAVQGSTMALRFRHDPDSVPYMTGEGPLVFAGC